jgi:hypothetical protein
MYARTDPFLASQFILELLPFGDRIQERCKVASHIP